MENKFNEEDKKKVIHFLNFLFTHTIFKEGLTHEKLIEYYKLLSHMQATILPKIEANILEIIEVVTPEKNEELESEE